MGYESDLILGIAGLPPESARNCVQELSPVANGEFKRTINGALIFLESNERKRYRSVISCKDMNTPIIDSIWVGTQVMVGCVQNLWQSIDVGKTTLQLIRPPVDGSVNVVNNFAEPIRFYMTGANEVKLYKKHSERIFVSFRPWLNMYVIDFSLETNEWDMNGGWRLVLEEA